MDNSIGTEDFIEKYAIRCALGNNGGEWSKHYREEHKEYWRKFVREIIQDISVGINKSNKLHH
mgnify:CR=1 FL=1